MTQPLRKDGKPREKSGPKQWKLTPKRLQTIEELARKGCTQETIARQIGLHPSTYYEKKKLFPEMEEAIQKAKACSEEAVVGYLWNIITDPKHPKHFSAIVFYLKAQHKWEDKKNNDDGPKNGTFQGYSIETIEKKSKNENNETVEDDGDDE